MMVLRRAYRGRVAATPRPPGGYSAETNRGDAATRRRRGRDADVRPRPTRTEGTDASVAMRATSLALVAASARAACRFELDWHISPDAAVRVLINSEAPVFDVAAAREIISKTNIKQGEGCSTEECFAARLVEAVASRCVAAAGA